MLSALYKALENIGYTHPLHPAVTHIPLGLVIGGFVFSLTGIILKRPSLAKTARHCFWLALLSLPVAALFGLMDWKHFYAGAWMMPIIMKMILAAILLVLLIVTLIPFREKVPLILYFLCLLVVIGLGYFGGELVYGTRGTKDGPKNVRIEQGADYFAEKCAMCHYNDRSDTRIGPGFKDLFKNEKLPISGKPVTKDSVKSQLKTPFEKMPAFTDITEEELDSLIEYLKTL